MSKSNSSQKYAKLVPPFADTDHWLRVQVAQHTSRVSLASLARALNLPTARLLTTYLPILIAEGSTLQTNRNITNGYVFLRHLPELLAELSLGWTREQMQHALACFDLDALHDHNGGKNLRGGKAKKPRVISLLEEKEEPEEAGNADDNEDDDLYVNLSVQSPPAAAAPLGANDWQAAFQAEMRAWQGTKAVVAYRASDEYKKATVALLREEIMKDDTQIRAAVAAKLEEELYADIKDRVNKAVRAQYAAHPELDVRLQQQEARRALISAGSAGGASVPPRKEASPK